MPTRSERAEWWFSFGVTFLFLLGLGAVLAVRNWSGIVQRRDQNITNYAMKGDLRGLRFWMLTCRDPNRPSSTGFTPLIAAASQGQNDIVRFLLAQGVDIDARNALGYTALAFAIGHRRVETIKILLANGADPFAVSTHGYSASTAALYLENPEIFELILKKMDASSMEAKETLIQAVTFNNTDAVRLLTSYGVRVKESDNRELIRRAKSKRNTVVVELLESAR